MPRVREQGVVREPGAVLRGRPADVLVHQAVRLREHVCLRTASPVTSFRHSSRLPILPAVVFKSALSSSDEESSSEDAAAAAGFAVLVSLDRGLLAQRFLTHKNGRLLRPLERYTPSCLPGPTLSSASPYNRACQQKTCQNVGNPCKHHIPARAGDSSHPRFRRRPPLKPPE